MAQILTPWREVFPPPSMSLTLHVPVFFGRGWSRFHDVLSLLSCFAKFAESGPLPTYVLTNYVPRFLFSPFCFVLFYFLLFPSISIDDMGATSGGFFSFGSLFFLLLACFQMGFYFVTTGWIVEIGLSCENSINQSTHISCRSRIFV